MLKIFRYAIILLIGCLGSVAQAQATLPAPFYFLGADSIVYRLEIDGLTTTPVSPNGTLVNDFVLAPNSTQLAMVTTDNRLVVVDEFGFLSVADGGFVEMSEDGFPSTKGVVEKAISSPSFSPDGTKLLYGYRGINVYDFATNTSINIVPNIQPEDANDEFMIGATIAGDSVWSPDSTKALVYWNYALEGGFLMLIDLINNTVMLPEIKGDDNFPLCCADVAWSNDNSKVYFASAAAFYPGEAGLWVLDVASGVISSSSETLKSAVALADGTTYTPNDIIEFTGAKDAGNGTFYFLMGVSQITNGAVTSAWNLYLANGGLVQRINAQAFPTLSNVFWSPNGEGFIAQFNQTYAYFGVNNVTVPLPLEGYNLQAQWGKN